ncbi:MAG: hypothetical protein ACR2P0_20525 [Acidimicrobiales bacterium]
MKKFLAICLTAAMILGLLAGPAAADDHDNNDRKANGRNSRPELVKQDTAAVLAGASTWVNVLWVADGAITDFSVTAEAKKDVVLGYSVTTGDHAGPMNGYDMEDLETDFTALYITVPEDYSKRDVKLEIEAEWTNDDGESEDKKFNLRVPVAHYEGTDWQVVDSTADLGSGWVEIPVLGLAPASSRIQFGIEAPAGLNIYLPQETWTGPHHDSQLDAGESDVVRFYIEPGQFVGPMALEFEATWERSGDTKSMLVPFTVNG